MAEPHKVLSVNSLMNRLPVGGLFIVLILFGVLLLSLNSEPYVQSLCLSLVCVNALNVFVFPFKSTLSMLQDGSTLNQWQRRWLKSQILVILVGAFGIGLVLW